MLERWVPQLRRMNHHGTKYSAGKGKLKPMGNCAFYENDAQPKGCHPPAHGPNPACARCGLALELRVLFMFSTS